MNKDRFRFRVYVKNDIDLGADFLGGGILKKGYLHKKYPRINDLWWNLSPNGYELMWGCDDCETPLINGVDIDIEQCTGVRDKNGVLIFEGDILETTIGDKHMAEYSLFNCRWELVKIHKSAERWAIPLTENAVAISKYVITSNIHKGGE